MGFHKDTLHLRVPGVQGVMPVVTAPILLLRMWVPLKAVSETGAQGQDCAWIHLDPLHPPSSILVFSGLCVEEVERPGGEWVQFPAISVALMF